MTPFNTQFTAAVGAGNSEGACEMRVSRTVERAQFQVYLLEQ